MATLTPPERQVERLRRHTQETIDESIVDRLASHVHECLSLHHEWKALVALGPKIFDSPDLSIADISRMRRVLIFLIDQTIEHFESIQRTLRISTELLDPAIDLGVATADFHRIRDWLRTWPASTPATLAERAAEVQRGDVCSLDDFLAEG